MKTFTWYIVYHDDPEQEVPFQGDGVPNHKDRNIKFIVRYDDEENGDGYYYVPKEDGWMRVDEERAERQRQYVPREHIREAVHGHFPRR